jgi:hypothetical protein
MGLKGLPDFDKYTLSDLDILDAEKAFTRVILESSHTEEGPIIEVDMCEVSSKETSLIYGYGHG